MKSDLRAVILFPTIVIAKVSAYVPSVSQLSRFTTVGQVNVPCCATVTVFVLLLDEPMFTMKLSAVFDIFPFVTAHVVKGRGEHKLEDLTQ